VTLTNQDIIQQREAVAREEDYDNQEASQAAYYASENKSDNSRGRKKVKR
jgi:hypothetical protein